MKIQKKQFQNIIMIVIVVITMTGFGFWVKYKISCKINPKTENEQIQHNNTNIQIKQKEASKEQKSWHGEVIDTDNNSKKYSNDFFGIEFSFFDENNNLIFKESKDRITIYGPTPKEKLEKYPNHNPEDLIDPYAYFFPLNLNNLGNYFCNGDKQNSFKEYLEAGCWNNYENIAKLVSINSFKNQNGTTYYKVTSKQIKTGRVRPVSSQEFFADTYYIEKSKKDGTVLMVTLNDPNLEKQIIDSFKFIEN